MFRSKTPSVKLSIRRRVLDEICDECDRFAVDETGGRIIGTYQKNSKGFEVQVLDVIGAGPNAKRSPTTFFQDGEYQEKVFRAMEAKQPDIEHLGNWHTHHVNGLRTLSSGDKATYRRIVNHDRHNTDFFYALLVVEKTSDRNRRYEMKHYVLLRGGDSIYEISDRDIEVVEDSGVRRDVGEAATETTRPLHEMDFNSDAKIERVKDQEFFSEFYPGLKAIFPKSLGTLCWKGSFPLVDGSRAEVVAMENLENREPSYSIAIARPILESAGKVESYRDRSFKSARQAILHLERDLNRELYLSKKG